jgi:CelD/BcsL family acetyltransferase involved in cellulose biosynthesis
VRSAPRHTEPHPPRTPAARDAADPPGPKAAPPAHPPTAATTPGHPEPGAALDVTVCRDPAEFGALGPEWDRLHRRCPAATAFQTHAWLHSWWLSYGRPGRLRLVLVRRGGHLVAAAPLMRARRVLPVVVPLGGAVTDYTDVLLDPRDPRADQVTDALARGVRRAARGAVVDLREVRPGAAAELLHERWPGPKRQLPDSVCLELPGLPMDGLIARVGSSRGQRIRSELRRIDRADVEERDVPAAEVPVAVETMLRLHLSQWQGRGVTPEHLRPRYAEHLTRAGGLMVASGDAVITEFRLAGEVVAANLTVLSPGLAGGYLYGAHPDLRAAKVDVTTLLMRHGVRQTTDGGRPVLSLLRGAEPHKSHWRPEPVTNHRLLLANRSGGPVLYARHALAAARARLTGSRLRLLRALRDRAKAVRARGAARPKG